MIEETLNLLGKIALADPADQITLLDGDAVEVNIIRGGERMTILNLSHFDVDREGERIPVDPLGIQITIERAVESGEAQRRPSKLGARAERKPRAKGAKKLETSR